MGGIFAKYKTVACKRVRLAKWYGKFTDADGVRRERALATDKQVARQMLAKLVRDVERRKSGLADCFTDAVKKPLAEHVADYKAHLEAKGDSAKHIADAVGRIEEIISGCGFKSVAALDAPPVAQWLASQRASKSRKFGYGSSNASLKAAKGFSRWLWENRRTIDHRLVGLKPLNLELDERHQRRSLTEADFRRLLATTKASPDVILGMGGQARGMLYIVASLTGLRASEIASLRVANFDFSENSFSIKASNTKAKKSSVLGLNSELEKHLQEWIADNGLQYGDKLFNIPKHFKYAKLLRSDLKTANIPYILDGYFFDFHALRGQLATMLERAGVSLKKAQEIMRHSTPALTSKYYSRPDLADLTGAVNQVSLLVVKPTICEKKSA